eukprot:scaffold239086_cov28-Tisochrysis_lutea.AAC.2
MPLPHALPPARLLNCKDQLNVQARIAKVGQQEVDTVARRRADRQIESQREPDLLRLLPTHACAERGRPRLRRDGRWFPAAHLPQARTHDHAYLRSRWRRRVRRASYCERLVILPPTHRVREHSEGLIGLLESPLCCRDLARARPLWLLVGVVAQRDDTIGGTDGPRVRLTGHAEPRVVACTAAERACAEKKQPENARHRPAPRGRGRHIS